MVIRRVNRGESGQGVIEYILMLAIVVTFFATFAKWMKGSQLAAKLVAPLQTNFAKAYQYGHPKASGYDDAEGPKLHPRVEDGDASNFRLFINASKRK